MKKKIVYILILCCPLGFFSAARQFGVSCDKAFNKVLPKEDCRSKKRMPAGTVDVDLSPLNFFLAI